jgi:hypothetical protein
MSAIPRQKEKGEKKVKRERIANRILIVTLLFLLTFSSYAATGTSNAKPQQNNVQILNTQPLSLPPGQNNMTFSSGTLMNLTTGIIISMRTGIRIQFTTAGDPNLEPCFVGLLQTPPPTQLAACSWWEVLDPQGNPTGIEFHVDALMPPNMFHIDQVFPGPFPVPPWPFILAELKITTIQPCTKLTVVDTSVIPEPCSWWEIFDQSGNPTNYEFHVDVSYPNGTFHIDQVTPSSLSYAIPPPYIVQAEKKITSIAQCTNLKYVCPSGYVPQSCDWWEIIIPTQLKGKEFHIDSATGQSIHIDSVYPSAITGIIQYKLTAERKIPSISPCDWFKVANPSSWAPDINSWWRIVAPAAWNGVTFHVDQNSSQSHTFHIDQINGQLSAIVPPPYTITAQPYTPVLVHDIAITAVTPLLGSVVQGCPDAIDVTVQNQGDFTETFTLNVTYGSNQVTTSPITVSSLAAHSSQTIRFWWITAGVTPNPYTITSAAPVVPGETDIGDNTLVDGIVIVTSPQQFYWKNGFADYAPSGVPDFDERQDNWMNGQTWTWCAPVAVANSLWWLDSKFEPTNPPIAPPTLSDGFPLVKAYVPSIDDHDAANVQPFIQHLAYLMDTDGMRTLQAHTGTNTADLQAAVAQYLSWSGVNPLGDVNSDGVVNGTDASIVSAAMGKKPGQVGWNMAADIFPITTAWPGAADNVIDANDLGLVNAHLGQKGMFEQHTVNAPTLSLAYVEQEVKKNQDVVLQLGYWMWTGSTWYRESGHFVTVAGINATQNKIGVSDPIHDAFETGLIAQGRIPIPHAHAPLEPPYVTHNNAAFVSHDIYDVAPIPPGQFPPCPGGTLYLVNFPGWSPGPPMFTVIEAAIATSPIGVHDVAVTNLQRLKTVVGQTYTCKLNVTVQNQGNFTETFNVTVYAVTLPPSAQACKRLVSNLIQGETRTLTLSWNTTQWAYGNYSISAIADPVPGETNTANNTFKDSWVLITIPGDTTGDRTVNVLDLILVAGHLGHMNGDGHTPFSSDWYKCMNTDIQGDSRHDVLDLILCAGHLGQHW